MEESHEESLNVGKLFKCVVLTHSSGLRLLKREFSLYVRFSSFQIH